MTLRLLLILNKLMCGCLLCRVSTAVEYWNDCCAKDDQVHLLLLDLNLSHPDSEQLNIIISQGPNGFDVASFLELADSDRTLPFKGFFYKPLIAMVTSYATEVELCMPQNVDGSVNGCDLLLPKPLTADLARVLVEASLL